MLLVLECNDEERQPYLNLDMLLDRNREHIDPLLSQNLEVRHRHSCMLLLLLFRLRWNIHLCEKYYMAIVCHIRRLFTSKREMPMWCAKWDASLLALEQVQMCELPQE